MVKRSVVPSDTSTMGSVVHNHRTQKSTASRNGKDKANKHDRDGELFQSVKFQGSTDVLNGAVRTVTSGRGGRGGKPNSARAFYVHHNHPSRLDSDTLLEDTGVIRAPMQLLDPTLLTRGMTARYIGSRVSNHIKTLSAEEIEKDLRHMEAYRCAYIAYSQKYFAFINQDLLTRDMRGQSPTESSIDPPTPNLAFASSTPIMPSKIDPEEEKRLSMLRKKIASSEIKREVIESEYVSYRAHFVYQCHKLLQARKQVYGQLHLLQDLMQKKGAVLAIQRVMCSILMDLVHGLLQLKTPSSSSPDENMESSKDVEDHLDPNMVESNPIWDTWTTLESQLKSAESALNAIRPPKELVVLKTALTMLSSSTTGQESLNGTSRRSRSPSKTRGIKDEEDSTTHAVTKKKSKDPPKWSATSNQPTEEKGKQPKAQNTEETVEEKDSSEVGFGKRKSVGYEDRCIPWNCLSQPRTPVNLPLLLSLVSESSSKFAAYGVGNVVGTSPSSMIWMQKYLPKSVNMTEEENKLQMLQREVKDLKMELDREIQVNNDLQKEAIANRKRSDMLCSTMCILRTETEALVERHNIILDTSEVKERAAALDSCALGSISEDFDEEIDSDDEDDLEDEMAAAFGSSFDADHGDDSDSVDNTGMGDEEDDDEEDDANNRGVHNRLIQELKKDDKEGTVKGNASKRSFEGYAVEYLIGQEERKRRKP